MWIITKTTFVDSIVQIIDVKYNLLEATSSFVNLVDSLTSESESVIFISKNQAHIINRNVGWISTSKEITYVIQMIEYKTDVDYYCSKCSNPIESSSESNTNTDDMNDNVD